MKRIKLEEDEICRCDEWPDQEDRRYRNEELQGFRPANACKEEEGDEGGNNDAKSSIDLMFSAMMNSIKAEDEWTDSGERKYDASEVSAAIDSDGGICDKSGQQGTIRDVKVECDSEDRGGRVELAGPSRESGCKAEQEPENSSPTRSDGTMGYSDNSASTLAAFHGAGTTAETLLSKTAHETGRLREFTEETSTQSREKTEYAGKGDPERMKLEEEDFCRCADADMGEDKWPGREGRRYGNKELQGFRPAYTCKEEEGEEGENNDAKSSGDLMFSAVMNSIKAEDEWTDSEERKHDVSEVSAVTDSDGGICDRSGQEGTIRDVKVECDSEVRGERVELAGPSGESGCRAEHGAMGYSDNSASTSAAFHGVGITTGPLLRKTAQETGRQSEFTEETSTQSRENTQYAGTDAGQLKTHITTQARGKFACEYCNYTFTRADRMKIHRRIHTGEKPFACTECGYKCSTSGHLKAHMYSHSAEEKPFPCSLCDYSFIHSGHLRAHMKTHTGEKPFTCDVCNFKCRRSRNLKMHMMTHTGEKPYACEECNYKCRESNRLKHHMRIHTGEKPFACNECEYKGSSSRSLNRHLVTHNGDKPIPFVCAVCGLKCSERSRLKMHMRSHTGEKPFACNECEYKGSSSGSLKRHLVTHTGDKPKPKPYVCTVCDLKCSEPSRLKIHMRSHTGEKPFACTQCDYKCSISGSMTAHMYSHTGAKPFPCNLCDYSFTKTGHLRAHMRTHTGEKPFACHVCNLKFRMSSSLKRHMMTHTGEKPFACEKCKKMFRDAGHLKRHMRTHTGEKPFACKVCDYKSRQSGTLKTHMRTHTREKPFSCNECGFKGSSSASLKAHMRAHKGEKAECDLEVGPIERAELAGPSSESECRAEQEPVNASSSRSDGTLGYCDNSAITYIGSPP